MAKSPADVFLAALEERPETYLVGIAGVPGSGKTTLCREIAARRPEATVISMDGYHLPRSRLDAEGMRRRGALHTFDGDAFYADMQKLRHSRSGLFPSFDHAEKDPRPGVVRVTPEVPLVIVEEFTCSCGAGAPRHFSICECSSTALSTRRSSG
jgi:fructokinase